MTPVPIRVHEWLADELSKIATVVPVDNGVMHVTTHCMYPSNALVKVTVRMGSETALVSDDGGAVGEALSAGIALADHHKRTLAHLVREQGLQMDGGVIFCPRIEIDVLPIAILHVANASQDVAQWLYDHLKIKRTRDFRAMLADFLQKKFEDRVEHNAVIIGHSNKAHKFANVIKLPGGRRLIVDPVSHEASSINSRVVANLDVKATNNPLLDQRIVYDDEEEWSPADLNLLQVGAIAVPFSKSSEVIERITSASLG